MPNDAKLGLAVGVGVVIAISVVFFRKEPGPSAPLKGEAAAAAVGAGKILPAAPAQSLNRPVKAKPTARQEGAVEEGRRGERHHLVTEGETLFSLAERYYGDKEKFAVIYRANKEFSNRRAN